MTVTSRKEEQPIYTRKEVEKHNTEQDGWMIIEEGVYNVTNFIKMHPGGRDIMIPYLGKDATHQFTSEEEHSHSTRAYRILQKYRVGQLPTSEYSGQSAYASHHLTSLVDFAKPVLPQVIKMKPKLYQEWLHGASVGVPTFRIFEMELFEGMSRWPWWYIFILWVPVSLYLAYSCVQRTSLLATSVIYPLGFLSWGLCEYILHRWLFHVDTESTAGNFYHFFAHGIHHLTPLDDSRLTFPPWFGIVLGLGLYHLTQSIIPYVPVAEGIMAGFTLGYVSYDTLHYFFHKEHQFAWFPYFGYMKSRHNRHHYKTPTKNFGVTTPVFDWVFGTSAP